MSDESDEISPNELDALLDADDPVRVVDIRSPGAFERGHIPGSENVPFNQLPHHAAGFADAEHIVTVCPEGISSLQAMQLLRSSESVEGHVESLAGGLAAWNDSNHALEAAGTTDETTTGDAPF